MFSVNETLKNQPSSIGNVASKFQDTKNFFESRCKNDKKRNLSRGGSSISYEKPPPKYNSQSSKVSYLRSKLEKTSMDFDQVHTKKKLKLNDNSSLRKNAKLDKENQNQDDNNKNQSMPETTSILTSLLRSEPNLMQQIQEHYQTNQFLETDESTKNINSQEFTNESEESNLSVIINSDNECDNTDTDKSRVSFASVKSGHNDTFNVYSDSEEESLPEGWSIGWSNGRKFYIDHINQTSSWSHPMEKEKLPLGWEKIVSQQYGTYYVNHITKRTQFNSPYSEMECVKQSASDVESAERNIYSMNTQIG